MFAWRAADGAGLEGEVTCGRDVEQDARQIPPDAMFERVVFEALGAERALLLLERHVGAEVGVEGRVGKHLMEETSHPGRADDRCVGMSCALRREDGEDVGSLGVGEGNTGEPEVGMVVEGHAGRFPPKRPGAAPDQQEHPTLDEGPNRPVVKPRPLEIQCHRTFVA
jgi:hypothetical protein